MSTPKTVARTVAILMLVLVVLAPFSMLYVPSVVSVQGDAEATARQVLASEGLFRAGLVADVLIVLIEVAITALLYVLFTPVNAPLSLMAAFARLGMTVVQGVNLLNHLAVLLLLGGAASLTVFTPPQLHALALFFIDAHAQVVLIWGLFFALHLSLLAVLVVQSTVVPRWVGALLGVAAFCYFVQGFGTILLPGSRTFFTAVGVLSAVEIAFPVWLLIRGWIPASGVPPTSRPEGLDHRPV